MCWSLLNPFRCDFLLPVIQTNSNPTSPTCQHLGSLHASGSSTVCRQTVNGAANATQSKWFYTEPNAIRVARVRRPVVPAEIAACFFETEICDFRQDRYRAAYSAPLSRPCGPTGLRAVSYTHLTLPTKRIV